MIIDHRFSGILDQGAGHLIIYEAAESDQCFAKGVEVISNIGEVVDALFARAKSGLLSGGSKAASGATSGTAAPAKSTA